MLQLASYQTIFNFKISIEILLLQQMAHVEVRFLFMSRCVLKEIGLRPFERKTKFNII